MRARGIRARRPSSWGTHRGQRLAGRVGAAGAGGPAPAGGGPRGSSGASFAEVGGEAGRRRYPGWGRKRREKEKRGKRSRPQHGRILLRIHGAWREMVLCPRRARGGNKGEGRWSPRQAAATRRAVSAALHQEGGCPGRRGRVVRSVARRARPLPRGGGDAS